MIYIGIDPGVGGGLAFIDDHRVILATRMPLGEQDILHLLENARTAQPSRAMLERVGASPQMGVVSAFTFGKGYGALLMALTAARIPFDQIGPRQWQAAMGCLSGGDKNITKRRAQQLFPSLTVTHAIADALLLAEFCRRLETGRFRRKESDDGKRQSGGAPGGKTTARIPDAERKQPAPQRA